MAAATKSATGPQAPPPSTAPAGAQAPPAQKPKQAQAQPQPQPPMDSRGVGQQFVRQYYAVLQKSPSHLFRFFKEESVFGHESLLTQNDLAMVPARDGPERIQERIKLLYPGENNVMVMVFNVDSQPSLQGSVIVQVTGSLALQRPHTAPRAFSQTFFLAVQPGGYYVLNDILRFTEPPVPSVAIHAGMPGVMPVPQPGSMPPPPHVMPPAMMQPLASLPIPPGAALPDKAGVPPPPPMAAHPPPPGAPPPPLPAAPQEPQPPPPSGPPPSDASKAAAARAAPRPPSETSKAATKAAPPAPEAGAPAAAGEAPGKEKEKEAPSEAAEADESSAPLTYAARMKLSLAKKEAAAAAAAAAAAGGGSPVADTPPAAAEAAPVAPPPAAEPAPPVLENGGSGAAALPAAAASQQGSCAVFVRYLPTNVTEDILFAEFERFGKLQPTPGYPKGINIKYQGSRAYAFVDFTTPEAAAAVIETGITVDGKHVNVEEKKPQISTGRRGGSQRSNSRDGRGGGVGGGAGGSGGGGSGNGGSLRREGSARGYNGGRGGDRKGSGNGGGSGRY